MSETRPWVDGLTIFDAFRPVAERHGCRIAVSFPKLLIRRTYAELLWRVDAVARALLALGIERGEHIGVWSTNWPEWIELQLASARVGAVLVNVNPAYRAQELGYALGAADITTLFLIESFRESRYFEMLGAVRGACPKLRHAVAIRGSDYPGIESWDAFLARGHGVAPEALDARTAALSPDDVASLQFTSGTTGAPKGAMLTHRNLLHNALYVGRALKLTARDKLCIPVPFYHCFGCVIGTLMCAIHGAAMVIPAEAFDPTATLQAIAGERCTAVHGVPTMFIAQLEHPSFAAYDLSSLRTGIMAGSPCPIEVMRQVIERMGAREMTIAYGQTESSPGITITDPDEALEERVTTIGRALPGLEVRIVEPGTLQDKPEGEPGELIARGHCVMAGYYRRPEETAAAITPDGWLKTGDLGTRTPEGRIKITGRLKDLIIRGGENVYPREVEEFLFTEPRIAEAQVVGLPDARLGEEVAAFVRLKEGAAMTPDEVRAYCKGRIAHFKVPRYVAFVTSFPTTVTGKIQKYRLREMGIEMYGLAAAAAIQTA